MPVSVADIESELVSRGYRVIHETSKKRGYQCDGALPLYVNLKSQDGVTGLVAHPGSAAPALRGRVAGLKVSEDYYHSSNMRRFPQRLHTGRHPIGYGWGMTLDTLSALRAALDVLEDRGIEALVAPGPGIAPPGPLVVANEELARPMPIGEDVDAIGSRRIGHDEFRAALVSYWGTCAVTGLGALPLLRASHIKPWALASASERTDPFNGLLLAPHLDAAFDAGLVSFDDAGAVILSSRLPATDAELLGLTSGVRLRRIDERHRPYLAWHRHQQFLAQR